MGVCQGVACQGTPGGDTVLDAMKRHEIHVLRRAGFSLGRVAEKAKVSRNTVQRVLRDALQLSSEATGSLRMGRPPVAAAFEAVAKQALEEDAGMRTVEVLRRMRLAGYAGGKTPAYELVAKLRRVVVAPLVRFEGVAGEFCQNDFGSVRVRFMDGSEEKVHFFASRLKWSRWCHVEIVPNEQVEQLVRPLLRAFESFGGVPLVCVFDNPKTVVVSRKGGKIEWNPVFGQVALDYRFAVELCTPRRGQEKGSVENLVGFVKNGFFKARRFHDRADLGAQLREWLMEVNERRANRATGVAPSARIDEERRRLRGLPVPSGEYALRYAAYVGPTAWVRFQGARYSMPARAMNVPATVFVHEDVVRIVTDKDDVRHPRNPANGVSTLPSHATSVVASLSGKRAKLYSMRERILELGGEAEEFLTELVHARPRTWSADVEALFDLLIHRRPETVLAAMREALLRGQFGSEYVLQWVRPEEALA